jgi:hypothetical protein
MATMRTRLAQTAIAAIAPEESLVPCRDGFGVGLGFGGFDEVEVVVEVVLEDAVLVAVTVAVVAG